MDRVKAEEMANPGVSEDKQKLKKCEGFLSLLMYHAVTADLALKHIMSHAMGSHMFLRASS